MYLITTDNGQTFKKTPSFLIPVLFSFVNKYAVSSNNIEHQRIEDKNIFVNYINKLPNNKKYICYLKNERLYFEPYQTDEQKNNMLNLINSN